MIPVHGIEMISFLKLCAVPSALYSYELSAWFYLLSKYLVSIISLEQF